jgi:LemA protein
MFRASFLRDVRLRRSSIVRRLAARPRADYIIDVNPLVGIGYGVSSGDEQESSRSDEYPIEFVDRYITFQEQRPMTLLAELSQNTIILLVVAGIALLFLFYFVGIYNRLVALRNRYKNAFAQIDVQLKRRYDLIPNLVEIAKGYMKHERETLEAVIAARNLAASAGMKAAASPGDPAAMQSLAQAEGQLQGTLGRLFALAESYPDLKANQNMMQLQEELTSTENKVAFARQAYNDAVMTYNTKRETFPDLIVANFSGFTEAKMFEVEQPAEREAPKVKF